MTAREVERTGRTGRRAALVKVAVVYLLGFALPVYVAIHYLASARVRARVHTHPGWHVGEIVELSLDAAAVVVALVLLAREAPTWWRPSGSGWRSARQLRAFGLGWTAMLAGGIAARLLGIGAYPSSHAAASAWPVAINSLAAGPGEEIVVLVTPVVFLRAAGWKWWQVVPACLALRLAYHVYYGWPAIGLSVWAVAMVFVYLRTHAVLGLVVAHSYWDLTGTIGVYLSTLASALMFLVPLLAVIVWSIVATILALVRRHGRKVDRERRTAASARAGWYQNDTGHWWWWDGRQWIRPPDDVPRVEA